MIPRFLKISEYFRRFLSAGIFIACASAQAAPDVRLRVWSHQGQESENRAVREIADAFNAAHRDRGWVVELSFFPDFQYTEKLAVAAAARDLPDVFDLDGPLVARFADVGLLKPLDEFLGDADRSDFLPTILAQGTVDGRLYALGSFDSALVVYYDRELLARADVTPPAEGQGWSWDDFLAACGKLKAAGIEPVALHMNESADEWFTYAFSPVVWSAGGRLIADDVARVRGELTSEAAVRGARAWQELFARGFAATDPVEPDPFGLGRVAMDWSGHWMVRGHLEAKGERLGVMPLPSLGAPSAACGSWCWAISAETEQQEAAVAWLRWVTEVATGVVPLVRANGAVPARRSAFAHFPEYEQMPYALFRTQLETSARPRPRTPFYATLTQQFAAALRDISRGADVESRLRKAEEAVQRVIDRKRPTKTAEASGR